VLALLSKEVALVMVMVILSASSLMPWFSIMAFRKSESGSSNARGLMGVKLILLGDVKVKVRSSLVNDLYYIRGREGFKMTHIIYNDLHVWIMK
jgi:hypothetical protein